MVYTTHMLIADEIYKRIDANLKSKFKKNSFKYGNVRPDLSRIAVNIPHTLNESFIYITNEIERLVSETNETKQMSTRDFAKRLGIINHYVADYFCLAHNKNIMNEGFIKHVIYEIKINKICKEDEIVVNQCRLEDDDFKKSGCETIQEYILYKHANYLAEERSQEIDITYAIQACMTVTDVIIGICIQNCESKAA